MFFARHKRSSRRALARASSPAVHRARIAVEQLEDRNVPSGLITISGPSHVDEGSPYELSLSASVVVTEWSIDWGDGAVSVLPGSSTTASHTYADGLSTPTITATATYLVDIGPTYSFNGHYYALTSGPSNWLVAENAAVALGGHLVSITSAAEQTFINSTFLAAPNNKTTYWMGFIDQLNNSVFTWTSGEAVTYTNWNPGEPNNFGGNENYGTINWHVSHNRGIGDTPPPGSIADGKLGDWNDAPLNGINTTLDGPEPYAGIMEFNQLPTGVATDSLSITVENVAPSIAISGNSSVNEASLYTLILGEVTDPGTDTVTSYIVHWGDGQSDTYSANGAVTHTYADGPNTYAISVDLVDEDGTFENRGTPLSVTVDNVAPTAGVSGPGNGVRGQARTFVLTATDVSQPDQDAGFTFEIDWDGNDTVDQTVSGPSGTSVDHTFTTEGLHQVQVWATDKDGGKSDAAQHTAPIAVVELQVDPLDPNKLALFIGGTTGADVIVARRKDASVEVTLNGAKLGCFSPSGSTVVYGQAGNDALTLQRNKGETGILFGDAGNDTLTGGLGDDVLVGGEGDDVLTGAFGYDVLIGGDGTDALFGNPHDDLLIEGSHPAENDALALLILLEDWRSGKQ
jgi:hypothetical protein